MRIGLIGAGMIGGTLAELFVNAGHEVAVSNSRGPDSLAPLVGRLGPDARAATVQEASAFGDVVVLAIPFGKYSSLPAAELKGKIVVDPTNYYPQRDGVIDFGGQGSSEWLAAHIPGARVVKAFNTIYFQHLATQGDTHLPPDRRRVIFVAGDDAEAKRLVSELIAELGFAPLDTGSLREGGFRQQPGSAIYNQPLNALQARAALAEAS